MRAAPDGPALLGSVAPKRGTEALIGGWSSNIVRAVATRALSLTELNVLVPKISYPTLERKLSAMRIVKQVEPQNRQDDRDEDRDRRPSTPGRSDGTAGGGRR